MLYLSHLPVSKKEMASKELSLRDSRVCLVFFSFFRRKKLFQGYNNIKMPIAPDGDFKSIPHHWAWSNHRGRWGASQMGHVSEYPAACQAVIPPVITLMLATLCC